MVFAYIDPGAGSLIIQAAIAGIVALPILLRRQFSSLIGVLRLGRQAKDQHPADRSAEPASGD